MNARQLLVFESLNDTVNTLSAPDFNRPEIAPLRGKLQKAVQVVRALYQAQDLAGKTTSSDGAQIASYRRDIRKRLLRVSRHAVVTLEGLPGIEDELRVPHANAPNDVLLEATDRIIRNLRPHLRTLSRAGFPKDAIPQLQALARALEAKSQDGDTAIARRSSATRSIPEALRRGRKLVSALDSIIKAEFAKDLEVLHKWDRAKRIPRKLGRPRRPRRPRNPPEPQS